MRITKLETDMGYMQKFAEKFDKFQPKFWMALGAAIVIVALIQLFIAAWLKAALEAHH